mmetsp:Transcript_37341/g.87099  ORF Transcript_37341/g.87099 Transcript_37341/m.87099 type:complete len:317 (-) Transcript_37341:151-1101(-)
MTKFSQSDASDDVKWGDTLIRKSFSSVERKRRNEKEESRNRRSRSVSRSPSPACRSSSPARRTLASLKLAEVRDRSLRQTKSVPFESQRNETEESISMLLSARSVMSKSGENNKYLGKIKNCVSKLKKTRDNNPASHPKKVYCGNFPEEASSEEELEESSEKESYIPHIPIELSYAESASASSEEESNEKYKESKNSSLSPARSSENPIPRTESEKLPPKIQAVSKNSLLSPVEKIPLETLTAPSGLESKHVDGSLILTTYDPSAVSTSNKKKRKKNDSATSSPGPSPVSESSGFCMEFDCTFFHNEDGSNIICPY